MQSVNDINLKFSSLISFLYHDLFRATDFTASVFLSKAQSCTESDSVLSLNSRRGRETDTKLPSAEETSSLHEGLSDTSAGLQKRMRDLPNASKLETSDKECDAAGPSLPVLEDSGTATRLGIKL
jgi:hypothetical protein